MTDMETFILDNQDKIFRWYKYKTVWTPFELDKKYSDESIFENGGYANFCYIRQAIELPDGDVLLKLEDTHSPEDDILYTDEDENDKKFTYEKLSNIVLEEYSIDNEKRGD